MSSAILSPKTKLRHGRMHIRHSKEWLEEGNFDESFRGLCKASELLGAKHDEVRPFLLILAAQTHQLLEQNEFIIAEKTLVAAVEVSGIDSLSQQLATVRAAKAAYCKNLDNILTHKSGQWSDFLDMAHQNESVWIDPISSR